MSDQIKNERLAGLDIFRILAAFVVFLFHSNIHVGCYYGILNEFVNMGAVYMTGFFLLSGYVLYYTYSKRNLSCVENLKIFYLKRAIGILPLYYAVSLIYIIFLGTETAAENLLLAPIEILGLQSTFSTLFGVTHNGGTWFVSCLIICYLIYPFIQEIAKQINLKTKIIIIALCWIVLLISPFIVYKYQTVTTYADPFYRLLEFMIGVLLCSMKAELENTKCLRFMFNWITILVEFIIMVVGVTIGMRLQISPGNYMLYNWVVLPMFVLSIVSMAEVRNNRFTESRVIKYLSAISYAFFFAQFFTWNALRWIMEKTGIEANWFKIIVSTCMVLIISIILHEAIEQPCSRLLRKKLVREN